MVLLLKTFRDHGRAYFFWTIGLLGIVALELSVYPTVKASAAGLMAFIDNYPVALRKIFRMEDYTSGAGFLSTELFNIMVPLIFISIGASWGADASAQEEERRTADILLTLPLSRVRILGTKIIGAVFAQLALAIVLVISLLIGIHFVNLSLGVSKIVAGALTSISLGILFNAVATLVGAAWGRRSIALGSAIAAALAGYLLFSLSPIVNTFERITSINPFQWTLGSRPLYEGVDYGYLAISLSISLCLYMISLFVFRRRDIQA